MLLKPT
jgi:Dullard-like phosphatase family protein